MKMTIVIEGAKELEANLATLPQRIERKVIRQAVRDGQRPMLAAAKSNAAALGKGIEHHGRDMSALLAKNIVIKAPRKQKKGSYALHVQMRAGVDEFVYYRQGSHTKVTYTKSERKIGKTVGRTYIPAAIELGHFSGDTYVPPVPFMRPAAEATQGETIRRFTDTLRTGLLREAIVGRNKG